MNTTEAPHRNDDLINGRVSWQGTLSSYDPAAEAAAWVSQYVSHPKRHAATVESTEEDAGVGVNRFVLNLSQCLCADSSGVALLIELHRGFKTHDVHFVIAQMPRQIERMLSLLNIRQSLTVTR